MSTSPALAAWVAKSPFPCSAGPMVMLPVEVALLTRSSWKVASCCCVAGLLAAAAADAIKVEPYGCT